MHKYVQSAFIALGFLALSCPQSALAMDNMTRFNNIILLGYGDRDGIDNGKIKREKRTITVKSNQETSVTEVETQYDKKGLAISSLSVEQDRLRRQLTYEKGYWTSLYRSGDNVYPHLSFMTNKQGRIIQVFSQDADDKSAVPKVMADFIYDKKGRLKQISSFGSANMMKYDAKGLLTETNLISEHEKRTYQTKYTYLFDAKSKINKSTENRIMLTADHKNPPSVVAKGETFYTDFDSHGNWLSASQQLHSLVPGAIGNTYTVITRHLEYW